MDNTTTAAAFDKTGVIGWLVGIRDFAAATSEAREMAQAAITRLVHQEAPPATPDVVVTRDQAEAFLDVLVGRSWGENCATDKSPHVITHLRAALGLRCLPDNIDALRPWSAEDLTKAERLLAWLAGVIGELFKALDEHKATSYPGPSKDPDIPF